MSPSPSHRRIVRFLSLISVIALTVVLVWFLLHNGSPQSRLGFIVVIAGIAWIGAIGIWRDSFLFAFGSGVGLFLFGFWQLTLGFIILPAAFFTMFYGLFIREDAARPIDNTTSRWWYWLAAYPVYTIISLVGITTWGFATQRPIADTPQSLLVFLVAAGVGSFLSFMVLFAFYFDSQAIRSADLAWQPKAKWYALGVIGGSLIFVLSPLVVLYYLYQRRRHVGVP